MSKNIKITKEKGDMADAFKLKLRSYDTEMAKEFFLRAGYKGESIKAAAKLISEAVNITFTESDDMFLGKQLMYEGGLADKILITANYFEEDDYWMCEELKDHPVIISCAFRGGKKDTENEMKAAFLRGIFNKIEDFTEIDFEGRDPREFDPKEAFDKKGIDMSDEVILPNQVKH